MSITYGSVSATTQQEETSFDQYIKAHMHMEGLEIWRYQFACHVIFFSHIVIVSHPYLCVHGTILGVRKQGCFNILIHHTVKENEIVTKPTHNIIVI